MLSQTIDFEEDMMNGEPADYEPCSDCDQNEQQEIELETGLPDLPFIYMTLPPIDYSNYSLPEVPPSTTSYFETDEPIEYEGYDSEASEEFDEEEIPSKTVSLPDTSNLNRDQEWQYAQQRLKFSDRLYSAFQLAKGLKTRVEETPRVTRSFGSQYQMFVPSIYHY